MTRRYVSPASLLLACCTLAACSDSVAPDAGHAVTVSFASSAATTSASRSPASIVSRSVTATSGSDVLVVTRVQVVLARMELQRAGATCAATAAAGDDTVDEHECAELQLAPMLVELPLDGSVANVLSVPVPAGSYASLEAKIRALRSDEDRGPGSQAFLAAHPELAGISTLVTGTFNGRAFTYTGAPRADLETNFSPPLAVDAAPVNLTVHADVTTWFKTRSGSLIDPSTANAGGANASTVADNIRRSFRAFRDDDRNGHDDDGRDHA
ncbi:MAG: hypothetical protein JWN79_2831 [Gemmatimonadetes bacterium]|nr:hypothetical protein [Gemmatimonadota bacterium]